MPLVLVFLCGTKETVFFGCFTMYGLEAEA